MTDLIIVESPGKVKTIEGYLGAGYKVAASVGHIRDLPENRMGVLPPDFRPEYVLTERGKEVASRLKRLASECNTIYLATDDDREGEAIAWHIQQALGLQSPKRITFTEITKTALKAALENPGSIDLAKVAAQEARRCLDRQVGYMVSPVVAEHLGDRSFSAGRVQSVAVRLVVDREEAITTHVPIAFYGASLSFGDWKAKWLTKPLLQSGEEYWTDKPFAEQVSQLKQVRVVSCEATESKSSPPAPFITSTLQKAAGNACGLGPKETMNAAQKLYEQGAITYMRTDSPNLSNDALKGIADYARANGLPLAEVPRKFKAKGNAQAAHECIRPSRMDVTEAGETEEQRKLYRLIWQRTICSQLQDARFDVRTAVLEGVDEIDGKVITLQARGKKLSFAGWKSLVAQDAAEDPEKAAADEASEASNPVPDLKPGDQLGVESGEVTESKTTAPPRFTEVSLVDELEKRGIGRPSTYAGIIEYIIETRSYVEKLDKKIPGPLKPTHRAVRLIKATKGKFKFLEYEFTRIAEEQLEAIAEGKTTFKALVSNVHGKLASEIADYQKNNPVAHPCPQCGRGLMLNTPPKKKDSPWWGCSGFSPEGDGCDYAAEDNNGAPGKSRAPELTEFECKSCNKPLIHRVKEGEGGWSFFSCSGYKSGCQQSYPDKNNAPDYTSPKIKGDD